MGLIPIRDSDVSVSDACEMLNITSLQRVTFVSVVLISLVSKPCQSSHFSQDHVGFRMLCLIKLPYSICLVKII